MSVSINELLRKGIAAAREGDKAAARDLFQQVVDADEKNEKGWFWLASVVEDDDERRTCLENVLHINPGNERAQQILKTLNERAKQSINQEEVIPGVTRSQLTLILGGGVALIVLILIVALVSIISNNNRIATDNANATVVAAASTGTVIAGTATAQQIAVDATGTAVVVGATLTAQYTPIPTLTPTSMLPTLPPTWTPRPAGNLDAAAAATLPPPVGLSGRLAVWSGRDVLNNDFLDIGYYDLSSGNVYRRIGDNIGRGVSIFVSGERVIYSRYDPQLFSSVLESINLNGTQLESIQERFRAFDTVLDPESPFFSRDGRYVVFSGRPIERSNAQVWLLDLNAPAGTDPLTALSDDEFIYSYPAISPDNRWVVAVRTDNFSAATGTDLILIDVQTGGKIPVTNDLSTFTETNPRFSPDGSQIIYAAYPSNNPNNHDIYIKNAQGGGTPQLLLTDPSNDIFPVLSEDGRYMAFASNRSGAYDIYIFDLTGQTLWQLTSSAEDDYPGDWWQP